MADYRRYGPVDEDEAETVPEDALIRSRRMVLRQAEELSKNLDDLENRITHMGRELDTLKAARDVMTGALRGTEAVRAEMKEA